MPSIDLSSPLHEADPASNDELFLRDPLLLTSADEDRIINKLRADRQLWALEESAARAAGRRARPTATKAPKAKGALSPELLPDIDSLDLDL